MRAEFLFAGVLCQQVAYWTSKAELSRVLFTLIRQIFYDNRRIAGTK